MKFTNSRITPSAVLMMLGAVATTTQMSPASAFTPVAPQSRRTMGLAQPNVNSMPSVTSLQMSDKTDNNAVKELQKKAEEATNKVLFVDVQTAQEQLARNWGWIVTSGVLTMALGTAALLLPLLATGVAYNGTVLTIGSSGIINVINAFARENGHKAKSAVSGLLYLGLSYYMGTNPQAGLDIITLVIATVISSEGLYEAALAFKNPDLQGRGWHAVSGIGSVIVGLALSANLPATGLVTPGYALGARLTGSGATKVAVGLAGKEIADQKKKSNN